MSPKDITAIAIKFFAIYLLVNVVVYFPSMIVSMTALQKYHEETFSSEMFVSVVGAFIVLGITISFMLNRLANSIASKSSENTAINSDLPKDFLLQILGVYFIISGISSLPGIAISLFKHNAMDSATLLYGVGYIFQVVVGFYLVVKPTIWNQWLNKLRGRS
jgi:hypothetical protein